MLSAQPKSLVRRNVTKIEPRVIQAERGINRSNNKRDVRIFLNFNKQ